MTGFFIEYGYWGFFVASFLSATILPFSSEAILTALLVAGSSPMWCLLLGSVGNTLGGLTCYWIGSKGKTEWAEKYLGISAEKLEKIQYKIGRKGAPSAFFSFLPVVGDGINVALGFLHADIKRVTFYMFLGKFSRYFIWMILNDFLIKTIKPALL